MIFNRRRNLEFTIQNHFADGWILTSLLIIDLINTRRRKLYEIVEIYRKIIMEDTIIKIRYRK